MQRRNGCPQLDFVKLVENPTWKDVLIGLVNKEELDPWNIDIADITSGYLDVVKSMKRLDLHIPANLILAASIMLRIKSEAIILKDDYVSEYEIDDMPPELSFDIGFTRIESIPELTCRAKLPRKRKVTLNELLDAVEDAMKLETKREQKRINYLKNENLPAEIDVDKVDIEALIKDTYSQIIEYADQYDLVKFSDLLADSSADKVLSFLALLYLCTYEYIDLKQEKFFGDILINILRRESDVAKISLSI